MKKVQKDKRSTDVLEITKSNTADYVSDNDAFRFFPDKEKWRERLIYTLYKWAETEESENIGGKRRPHLDITQFCTEYRLSRSLLYNWRDQFPDIRQAMDHVKIILAGRRRVGAMMKELDKDVVFRDMHVYDKEWLEINKYNAELRNATDVPDTIRIELIPVRDTGKITPKIATKKGESNDSLE